MKRKSRISSGVWFAILGLAALAGYWKVLRPRWLHWGATGDEVRCPLPGDDLVADPLLKTTRSISIRATPAEIWPWLAQMGQGRGGYYSYDWLENIFGLNIQNAERILPQFQDLQVGDLVPFWQGAGLQVIDLQPERYLVMAGTLYARGGQPVDAYGGSWVFVLQPAGPGSTRLVVRSAVARFEPVWLSEFFAKLLLEPAHFIMERGMLLGIKRRAERTASGQSPSDLPVKL